MYNMFHVMNDKLALNRNIKNKINNFLKCCKSHYDHIIINNHCIKCLFMSNNYFHNI